MGTLWPELRYGVRVLAKSPGFALVAVLMLALGIGADAAIFSSIDAAMVRSLPVRDPERLVVFRWEARHSPERHSYSNYGARSEGREGDLSGCSFSIPLFEQMRWRAKSFSGRTAFSGSLQFYFSANGRAGMARGEIVVGNYFSTLGIRAAAGRLLGGSNIVSRGDPLLPIAQTLRPVD
jgi:hypothetical protein